jgi:hypothetical protein
VEPDELQALTAELQARGLTVPRFRFVHAFLGRRATIHVDRATDPPTVTVVTHDGNAFARCVRGAAHVNGCGDDHAFRRDLVRAVQDRLTKEKSA